MIKKYQSKKSHLWKKGNHFYIFTYRIHNGLWSLKLKTNFSHLTKSK